MMRSRSGLSLAICLLFAACTSRARPSDGPSMLIANATVIDGTGAPGRLASVRVRGDRIVEVGQLMPLDGERVFEANGLVLAPGFIDTHSHHDRGLFERRDALAAVSQGITTIVVGQDGGSP